jgi:hypothetical protein
LINKTKICPKCKISKSISEFNKDRHRKDELRYACRQCNDNRPNKKKENRNHVLRKFGITNQQYEDLYKVQNGLCAICGKPETSINQHNKMSLAVDHDHKTGIIRGLLCSSCNRRLGTYENTKEIFEDYLSESPKRMIKIYRLWVERRL